MPIFTQLRMPNSIPIIIEGWGKELIFLGIKSTNLVFVATLVATNAAEAENIWKSLLIL